MREDMITCICRQRHQPSTVLVPVTVVLDNTFDNTYDGSTGQSHLCSYGCTQLKLVDQVSPDMTIYKNKATTAHRPISNNSRVTLSKRRRKSKKSLIKDKASSQLPLPISLSPSFQPPHLHSNQILSLIYLAVISEPAVLPIKT